MRQSYPGESMAMAAGSNERIYIAGKIGLGSHNEGNKHKKYEEAIFFHAEMFVSTIEGRSATLKDSDSLKMLACITKCRKMK